MKKKFKLLATFALFFIYYYHVNSQSEYKCVIPQPLSSYSATTNSAYVTWSKALGAEYYVVRYKKNSSTGEIAFLTTTDTIALLSNLVPGTENSFNWTVRAFCSVNDSSNYPDRIPFTLKTNDCLSDIPTFVVRKNEDTVYTIYWNTFVGQSYVLKYKDVNDNEWLRSGIPTTNNHFTLTNLNYESRYECELVIFCENSMDSVIVSGDVLYTPQPCLEPPHQHGYKVVESNKCLILNCLSSRSTSAFISYSNDQYEVNYSNIISDTFLIGPFQVAGEQAFRILDSCKNRSLSNEDKRYFATPATTNPACNDIAIQNLSAVINSNTSTILKWVDASLVGYHNIRFKPITSDIWFYLTHKRTGDSLHLNNLQPGTTYEFQVNNLCKAEFRYTPSYTFTTTGQGCAAPSETSFSLAAIGDFSATINWDASVDAVSYSPSYKENANTQWVSLPLVSSASATITGLTSGTVYDFRVISQCSSGSSSNFSYTTFTTNTVQCLPPASPKLDAIVGNTAIVSWTPAYGAISYDIERKLTSATNWLAGNGFTATTYTISNLVPSSTYEFRVRTRCSASNVSSYSSPVTFNSLNINAYQQYQNSVKVYPNPNKGIFTLEMPSLNLINLYIKDISGKIVYTENIEKSNSSLSLKTLNVQHLQKGIYFLTINTENSFTINRKISIQ